MSTAQILENICKHIDLTTEESTFFLSLLESKHLRRKELLLQEGEICRHSAFVVQGALKGFTVDKEGNEHILHFALPDWWIADMYSLISRKPGIINIEAIVDADILLLSRDDQERLCSAIPKFERFFRILLENSLVASQQRIINNLSLSAEDRYIGFTQKYPSILECVPQHNIASYLGITPEFLSKIRARLAKKPAHS